MSAAEQLKPPNSELFDPEKQKNHVASIVSATSIEDLLAKIKSWFELADTSGNVYQGGEIRKAIRRVKKVIEKNPDLLSRPKSQIELQLSEIPDIPELREVVLDLLREEYHFPESKEDPEAAENPVEDEQIVEATLGVELTPEERLRDQMKNKYQAQLQVIETARSEALFSGDKERAKQLAKEKAGLLKERDQETQKALNKLGAEKATASAKKLREALAQSMPVSESDAKVIAIKKRFKLVSDESEKDIAAANQRKDYKLARELTKGRDQALELRDQAIKAAQTEEKEEREASLDELTGAASARAAKEAEAKRAEQAAQAAQMAEQKRKEAEQQKKEAEAKRIEAVKTAVESAKNFDQLYAQLQTLGRIIDGAGPNDFINTEYLIEEIEAIRKTATLLAKDFQNPTLAMATVKPTLERLKESTVPGIRAKVTELLKNEVGIFEGGLTPGNLKKARAVTQRLATETDASTKKPTSQNIDAAKQQMSKRETRLAHDLEKIKKEMLSLKDDFKKRAGLPIGGYLEGNRGFFGRLGLKFKKLALPKKTALIVELYTARDKERLAIEDDLSSIRGRRSLK